jgi:fibronectin type III domain protein/List-Bact-rpt repeat protein
MVPHEGGIKMKPLTLGRTRNAPCQRIAWRSLCVNIAIVMLAISALVQPASSAQLSLTWEDDTPSDHDGFKIERRRDDEIYGPIFEGQISQNPPGSNIYKYTDYGLSVNTRYWYRVRAYNLAGDSEYSNEAPGARYTLTVNKSGTGTGEVTMRSPDNDCESTCASTPLYSNSTVYLWATASADPATRSIFTGWTAGDGCTETARRTCVMEGAKTVTASFALDATAHSLTVSTGGSSGGSVSSNPSGIICSPMCTASFGGGAPVTLWATPDAGGTFLRWRGACTTSPCSPYINADKSVKAVFTKTFSDGNLTGGVAVKAVHITELRAAINTLRSRTFPGPYSGPYNYITDPTITPGTTPVKAAHLNDMCTALKEAYPAATCATTLNSTQAIQATHFTNLRAAVQALDALE